MKIRLYRNESEPNVIHKDLTEVIELDGTLREQVSIMTPRIVIQYVPDDESETGGFTNPTEFNYFYIPQFQRSYFVTDVVVINDKLLEIGGSVDVLESFWNDYKDADALIERSETSWNTLLNDSMVEVEQDDVAKIINKGLKSFDYANDGSYILLVAGSQSITPNAE